MEHSGSGGSSSSTSWKSGGRETMQGPRPAPLRVHKDSHGIIRKPRQPVIIYTVSPKVIHANPSDFMSVVQRLTGPPSAASSSSSHQPTAPTAASSSMPFPFYGAMPPPQAQAQQLPFPFHLQAAAAAAPWPQAQLSAAARLAAFEQASTSASVHRGDLPPLPSILSPVPGSLPPMTMPPPVPGFDFSPPSGINLFGELVSPSPAFLAGRHGAAGSATVSPPTSTAATMLQYFQAAGTGTGTGTAAAPSPSTPYYWDRLFNNNHPN